LWALGGCCVLLLPPTACFLTPGPLRVGSMRSVLPRATTVTNGVATHTEPHKEPHKEHADDGRPNEDEPVRISVAWARCGAAARRVGSTRGEAAPLSGGSIRPARRCG
jgi:hypothetical protein